MPTASYWEAKLSVLHERTAFAFRATGFLFRSVWNLESGLQRLCREVPCKRPSSLAGEISRLHSLTPKRTNKERKLVRRPGNNS
jgi:hypothetical protein